MNGTEGNSAVVSELEVKVHESHSAAEAPVWHEATFVSFGRVLPNESHAPSLPGLTLQTELHSVPFMTGGSFYKKQLPYHSETLADRSGVTCLQQF